MKVTTIYEIHNMQNEIQHVKFNIVYEVQYSMCNFTQAHQI